jgi:hypothetical protein
MNQSKSKGPRMHDSQVKHESTRILEHVHLDQAPSDADPTPMTLSGTRALTERFYAMKRIGLKTLIQMYGTEVVGGGTPRVVGVTSLASLPTTKPKRHYSEKTKKTFLQTATGDCDFGCQTWKHSRCPCACAVLPPHLHGWHEATGTKIDPAYGPMK